MVLSFLRLPETTGLVEFSERQVTLSFRNPSFVQAPVNCISVDFLNPLVHFPKTVSFDLESTGLVEFSERQVTLSFRNPSFVQAPVSCTSVDFLNPLVQFPKTVFFDLESTGLVELRVPELNTTNSTLQYKQTYLDIRNWCKPSEMLP